VAAVDVCGVMRREGKGTGQMIEPHPHCSAYCTTFATGSAKDSPRQQLTMNGVARVEEIETGLAASKALNESRPHLLRRQRHLMCLVLPFATATSTDTAVVCQTKHRHRPRCKFLPP